MNCQPIKDILRYHKIDCYALHTSTRPQQEKNLFKCVTRPDLSGVPLSYACTKIEHTKIRKMQIVKLLMLNKTIETDLISL